MKLQHLHELNERRLNSQSPEERDECFYLLSHDLIEAFPAIEKELLASRELVEGLKIMGIPDIPGDDMEAWRACNKRWVKQRDSLIQSYEDSIKE